MRSIWAASAGKRSRMPLGAWYCGTVDRSYGVPAGDAARYFEMVSVPTVNVAVALLLCASVAVQVTVVTPIGNRAPEAGAHVTGTVPSTRSVAVGLAYVAVAPAPLVALFVMFAGTLLIVGGVVSWTVTVN